jgi:hypothetical protein
MYKFSNILRNGRINVDTTVCKYGDLEKEDEGEEVRSKSGVFDATLRLRRSVQRPPNIGRNDTKLQFCLCSENSFRV